MSTTAVFAEFLIAGLGSLCCALLFAVAMLPSPQSLTALLTALGQIGLLKDYSTLITAAILGLAYVLGVVGDRVADLLLGPLESSRLRHFHTTEFAWKRLTVMNKASAPLVEFLNYQRSRLRLIRCTLLNETMLLASSATLWVRWSGFVRPGRFAVLIVVEVAVLLMTTIAWVRIATSHGQRQQQAHELVTADIARSARLAHGRRPRCRRGCSQGS